MSELLLKCGVEGGRSSGNIVFLEHINICAPSHQLVKLFYEDGLGFTPDPRRAQEREQGFGTLWLNNGISQVHIPEGAPQHVPGVVGLLYPDLTTLQARLAQVHGKLRHTAFQFSRTDEAIEITCPYGNRYKAFECEAGLDPRGVQPGPRSLGLGIAYIEYQVPFGTAKLISRFYQQLLGAHVTVEGGDFEGDSCVFGLLPQRAIVKAGPLQELVFTESHAPVADTGHHLAIYVQHFEQTFLALQAAGLVFVNPRFTDKADTLESAVAHGQFRIKEIVSLEDGVVGGVLYQLEHEVRSIEHPSCCLSEYTKRRLREQAPSTKSLNQELLREV